MKRRSLIQFAAACTGSIVANQILASCGASNQTEMMATPSPWQMPDESETHERTWMAFGASRAIWGRRLLPIVQDNLAAIATTIAEYEPVSMLVREADYDLAARKCGSSVNLITCPLDDFWLRDTGPVFVKNSDATLGGVDFNFNGWGEKQEYDRDAEVAQFVIDRVGCQTLSTSLVLEGGGIEVDGRGTAIITESSVLNPNRNPGVSKAECEAQLKALLGLRKIIWLPGVRGADITDAHVDFYARFVSPGVVVAADETDANLLDYEITKENLEILSSETDADGNELEVIVIENPQTIRPTSDTDEFAAGYINFYVINGAVLVPEFGDRVADSKAKGVLQDLYPQRDIIQLNIDAIATGGGGIHCTTQQQPQSQLKS
ncbi:MAG: agmatine deiminase family protein [Jaaginema sp. PMC 1079.18]|nr:agmatine deiminase family protein [Jaaginema sp. PMC 1080.18]MEC4850442.1 agmatine deiminase family protein [Jaaginema sp. PMC 1079.18]MEC4864882.1 agmatine deiminase family protein [Jaaginema sp. PMC 1078.18]